MPQLTPAENRQMLFQRISKIHFLIDLVTGCFNRDDDIDAINSVGGEYFGLIRVELTNSILLNLAKITDDRPDCVNIWTLAPKTSELGAALYSEIQAIRKHRNKRLAHDDLTWAKSAPALPVYWANIRKCRDLLRNIYNHEQDSTLHLPEQKPRLFGALAHRSRNLVKLYKNLKVTPAGEKILVETFGRSVNLTHLSSRS